MTLTAAVVGSYLLSFVTALSLINRNIPPEFKCAWLAFIAAVPVIGAVFYVVTIYKAKKCERTLRYDGCALPPPVSYERAVYLKDGAAYFDLLFREIAAAEKYVYLEYYIVARGEILERLIALLKAAHARGAEIKLIADGLGSALRLPRRKLKELQRAGAEIRIFHRLFPLPVSRLNFRDHRKIAVIDGKTALIGGINIADEYANLREVHGYWKDSGAAVYGQAATVYRDLFLSVWEGCKTAVPPRADGGATLCPVYDAPPVLKGFCEDAYCAAIHRATERVYAFTPYLCLGEKIRSALVYAVRRGVDVKIVIPHVPDKKLTFELTKSFAEGLAAAGAGIYEYTPGFMHAKLLLCDDEVFLGSYNLDFRSMQLNYECGAKFDGEIAQAAAADFRECLALSIPFEPDRRRLRRLARSVLKLFAPLA